MTSYIHDFGLGLWGEMETESPPNSSAQVEAQKWQTD